MKKQNNVGVSIARPLRRNQKGITLIALVITIIVLLILAGITINLTIGQDGILKRAQEAGKNYTNAADYENKQLGELTNTADRIIENVTGGNNGPEPKYIMIDGVPVPKGFTHTEGTKDTGFVIKNDTDGNEFVWIPCTIDGANGTIKYNRYSFGSFSNSSYSETMPSDEKTSIETYKGYYIGRYESGVIGYSTPVSTSSDGTETWTGYSNGTLVIQKEKQVWNYITRDRAKTESEGLYNKEKGDSVNSKLCSSYAWDTALKFIETKYPTYPTNSTVGNYKDKADILGKPALTGKTEAVNNIYDMGGNVWELTTEVSSSASNPCTKRGGDCYYSASSGPAADRDDYGTTNAYVYLGFRSTLYL